MRRAGGQFLTPNRAGAGANRDVIRNFVEPAGDGLMLPDGMGLARQDKEGGLESIFGFVHVMQNAPTQPQHHRSMVLEQRCERGLFATDGESFQQLSIVFRPGRRAGGETVEVMKDDLGLSLAHG
jgi:hypothetical protein